MPCFSFSSLNLNLVVTIVTSEIQLFSKKKKTLADRRWLTVGAPVTDHTACEIFCTLFWLQAKEF